MNLAGLKGTRAIGPQDALAAELCTRLRRPKVGAVVGDDERLIDAALDGESAAFGQLVTRYQDRLYNSLVHVVGSADIACDVVQDAFVQAYVKLETFQRASAFYTWLYRIAFNLAVSRRRRDRPSVSVEHARDVLGHEPVDRGPPPSARLEREERACQLRSALAALSEEHRAILVLREVDGFAYEQLSQILDLPIGTIRSRLYRARLQLRDQLKGVFQEDAT
jgi:RNA polymerase sigma-70 factor (ECF subfamily)